MWYGDVDIDDKEDACSLCCPRGGVTVRGAPIYWLQSTSHLHLHLAQCAVCTVYIGSKEHQSTDCNQLHTCTCTLHNVQCAVCTVQCEVCSVHSVHCKQRAPIYWLQSTSHMQLPAAKVHCKCKVQHIEHCTLQFWHQQFAVHQHQLILQTSKHCISATDYRCSLYFIMFCYVHNLSMCGVKFATDCKFPTALYLCCNPYSTDK